ncbi:MAG: hypothetical protein Q9165_007120 [Trypethelium subeluteriae]
MDPNKSWLRASSVSRSDYSRSGTPPTLTRRSSHYDQQRGSRGSAVSETRAAHTASGNWIYAQDEDEDSHDEDAVPENFQNLTEVNGPSPVDPRTERFSDHLEDRRRSSKRESRRSGRSASNFANAGGDLSELQNIVTQQASVARPMRGSATLFNPDLPPHTLEESLPSRPWEKLSSEPAKINRAATEMYTISYLLFFSILGTLARLGVEWLGFYPGALVTTSVLWANFGGSVFLGFLAEDRMLFAEEWGLSRKGYMNVTNPKKEEYDLEEAKKAHTAVKKQLPLYIGLSTGFCGSFTSFSSFMRDAFLALSNNLAAPLYHPTAPGDVPKTSSTIHRNGGFSFEASLAVIIITVALSVGGLKLGAHMAIFVEPYLPTIPFKPTRRILEPIVVVLGWGSWLGAIIMAIWPPNQNWRGQVIFALVFAPVGCLLRFYASLRLNGLVASFPLGTFAVNMLGTAVLGMAYDLQHVSLDWGPRGVGGGVLSCQILQGTMDGFCGCLTTVSTWVGELNGLRRAHAYIYGLATIGLGFSLIVAILGGVRWSVGWQSPICAVVTS